MALLQILREMRDFISNEPCIAHCIEFDFYIDYFKCVFCTFALESEQLTFKPFFFQFFFVFFFCCPLKGFSYFQYFYHFGFSSKIKT